MSCNVKNLNMARGKPSTSQLDLSNSMLDKLILDNSKVDLRNYGVLDGIESARELLGNIVGASKDKVTVFGNSSLEIMYQLLSDSFLYGVCGSTPWKNLPRVKWICLVPGYDRHFAMLEHLGVEMISVSLSKDGPDMDKIEEIIKDEAVKGVWCVPLYSNPTGISFSDEVVRRFARLKPAAKDFRIYWDNAYALHHLYEDKQDKILDIISECEKANNPDLVFEFVSTSKITFPGAGIAGVITSINNKEWILSNLKFKTIGYDKINQFRHVNYLADLQNITSLMKKHADIIRPKFELVESIFEKEISKIAKWTKPNGGYFITLYVDNCAKELIDLCKNRGLTLTEAGSPFPYHKDPTNSVIRIAPTYPSLEELEEACKIICDCLKEIKRK